jgi:ribosomal protein L29
MLNKEEKASVLKDIFVKKKSLLAIRIKRSSGDLEAGKTIKQTKKDIARLFTKLNAKKI